MQLALWIVRPPLDPLKSESSCIALQCNTYLTAMIAVRQVFALKIKLSQMLCVGLNFGHNFFGRLEGEGVFELFCERGEGSLKPNLIVFSCGEAVWWDITQFRDWGRFPEKKLLFFWILSKWGGSIKGVNFLQNANNMNFRLFFGLYTWPTKQVFGLYLRRILDNE